MTSLGKRNGGAAPAAPYVQAYYGVPNCEFEQTTEGFRVGFSKPHANYLAMAPLMMVAAIIGPLMAFGLAWIITGMIFSAGTGFYIGLLAGFASFIAIILKIFARKPSKVEVTRESVIIDGRVLARRDFAGFCLRPAAAPSRLFELGYTYGNQILSFGGGWEQNEGEEVARALNLLLRRVAPPGSEQQPAPEELRNARPTDF